MWTDIDPSLDDFKVITDRVLLMHSDFLLQAWGFVILELITSSLFQFNRDAKNQYSL